MWRVYPEPLIGLGLRGKPPLARFSSKELASFIQMDHHVGSSTFVRLLPVRSIPARAPSLHALPSTSSSNKLQLLRSRPRQGRNLAGSIRRRIPYAYRSLRVKSGGVTEIGESEFSSKVLGSERPVLVEFVADWCGPCRLISPAIEWAAQEYSDRLTVVKIDHDANPRLIEEYKVYGLPALILFKNGEEVPQSRREGAITKVKLKEYIDTLLESISVA